MKIAESMVKRAKGHLPYTREENIGNSNRYYWISKHNTPSNNFYKREIIHCLKKNTWSCLTHRDDGTITGCKYMAFGYGKVDPSRKYCSHIVSAILYERGER
jgi:hypothetical protein